MLRVETMMKSYSAGGERIPAINQLSFAVQSGNCYALLGPSGCGKTTALRCIAGLERPDSGRITIGNEAVCDVEQRLFTPTHLRSVGLVFQSYAIWPHLTVFENVAYPLRVGRAVKSRGEIDDRVMTLLNAVGLAAMAQRSATLLSGGQQQRVALARAVVRRPQLLLLDEPLSSLDARLRAEMRDELLRFIDSIGTTVVLVTHDQAEAFVLADRIGLMSDGSIVQEGTPRDLYQRPKDLFAATCLGISNLLEGRIIATVNSQQAVVMLTGAPGRLIIHTDHVPGDLIRVLIRPEDVRVSPARPAGLENQLLGQISYSNFYGHYVELGVAVGSALLRVLTHPSSELCEGSSVWLSVDPARCSVFRSTQTGDEPVPTPEPVLGTAVRKAD